MWIFFSFTVFDSFYQGDYSQLDQAQNPLVMNIKDIMGIENVLINPTNISGEMSKRLCRRI